MLLEERQQKESTGMATKAPLTALTMSRRTTLQMALAAAIAGRMVGGVAPVMAQDASGDGTWALLGNAGKTGEFPGPGLDLESALGELWRIPGDEFGHDPYFGGNRVAGYLDGVLYALSDNDNTLIARRLKDGQVVWSLSPAKIAESPSSAITPPYAGDNAFESLVAIDNDILLMSMSNDHLWALDRKTGAFLWDIFWAGYSSEFPAVVDHVAYINLGGDVVAVDLTGSPVVRWRGGVNGDVLGVVNGFVYVGAGDEVRALTADKGQEYWRLPLGSLGYIAQTYGVTEEGVFLASTAPDTGQRYLMRIGLDGQVVWKISGDRSSFSLGWVLGDTITTMTSPYEGNGSLSIHSRYAENGNLHWEMDVNTSRWTDFFGSVVCAGNVYALIGDGRQSRSLLTVVDPGRGEVLGAWDSVLMPLFVADGVMIAKDGRDVVAIGTVPAVLQAGGRATVTKDATLRGAPSDTAIERGQIKSGTLVDVTGERETSNGTAWAPVTEQETGTSGWLPIDVLAGQDGSLRFEAINLYEFGEFKDSPKFTYQTKAEITGKVDLRGAPSESSAKKSTLEAGTLVTVTSPPTKTDDGEWCPIKVDATGETGWVPVSVLKLAPAS